MRGPGWEETYLLAVLSTRKSPAFIPIPVATYTHRLLSRVQSHSQVRPDTTTVENQIKSICAVWFGDAAAASAAGAADADVAAIGAL